VTGVGYLDPDPCVSGVGDSDSDPGVTGVGYPDPVVCVVWVTLTLLCVWCGCVVERWCGVVARAF